MLIECSIDANFAHVFNGREYNEMRIATIYWLKRDNFMRKCALIIHNGIACK